MINACSQNFFLPLDVVLGVPGCYLEFVRGHLPADRFGIAAQNCYKVASGAFTGN